MEGGARAAMARFEGYPKDDIRELRGELQWGLYSFMVRDFSFTKIWGCIAWISLVCFFLFGSLGVCMFTESMKLHGSATAKDSN
jgi:hypothetical protein